MLTPILAFLIPVIGLTLQIIFSDSYSKKINLSKKMCVDFFIEEIRKKISISLNFFRDEINRIFTIQNSEEISLEEIRNLEIQNLGLDEIKNTYNSLKTANRYITKLESALSRITVYRTIFIIILSIAFIELFIYLLFKQQFKILEYCLISVSVLEILIILCDHTKISHIMDSQIEREYGI